MGEESALVSVILPFYSAETTLFRAIKSIADQSYSHLECLMISNNSSKQCIQIAEEFVKDDKRFKLITEPKQGVVFASNTGFSLAKGKYIARMDADDYSFPNRIKLQVEFLEKHSDYGAISGLVQYETKSKNTAGFIRYVDWVNSIKSYEEIINNQFVESPIVNPSAMWRKEVADKFGLYRQGNFPEDYEMWLRWLSGGVKIMKLNSVLIKWNDLPTRLTRTHPIYSQEAFFRIKTKYLALWLKKFNKDKTGVAIWGASRISRKYIGFLNENGIEIEFYIDIKKSRQINNKVVYYQDIPEKEKVYILVYMKHTEARKQIQEFLNSRGYREGINYLMLS